MNLLELSQTIRKVRQAQGLTVEQLAQKSGFSKGFISQVENFRQTPSLKAIVRIAEALGMPLGAFFSEDGVKDSEYTLGNINEGEEIPRNEGNEHGIRYSALAFRQIGRRMDPFVIDYTPATPREFMRHDSDEFFVLLEGKLKYFLIEDRNCHTMQTGDTLYLKANVPHRVELAEGCTHARGLVVYSDPKLMD